MTWLAGYQLAAQLLVVVLLLRVRHSAHPAATGCFVAAAALMALRRVTAIASIERVEWIAALDKLVLPSAITTFLLAGVVSALRESRARERGGEAQSIR